METKKIAAIPSRFSDVGMQVTVVCGNPDGSAGLALTATGGRGGTRNECAALKDNVRRQLIRALGGVPTDERQDSLPEMSPAWLDLIRALTLLSREQIDPTAPLNCAHGELGVAADSAKFTAEELIQLCEWGFQPDPAGGFYSFRFGGS